MGIFSYKLWLPYNVKLFIDPKNFQLTQVTNQHFPNFVTQVWHLGTHWLKHTSFTLSLSLKARRTLSWKGRLWNNQPVLLLLLLLLLLLPLLLLLLLLEEAARVLDHVLPSDKRLRWSNPSAQSLAKWLGLFTNRTRPTSALLSLFLFFQWPLWCLQPPFSLT